MIAVETGTFLPHLLRDALGAGNPFYILAVALAGIPGHEAGHGGIGTSRVVASNVTVLP